MRNQKRIYLFLLLTNLVVMAPAFSQQLEPAAPFLLVNQGYGAAALGMGGAFVAVADDLSTIYWNPAGLSQLKQVQTYLGFRTLGDSDEDLAAVAFPNRFESQQRFAVSGKQLQALSFSYEIAGQKTSWYPAFAWQRLPSVGPKMELKEIAGVVEFVDPDNLIFFQSEGDFDQEFQGGEDEYSFALAVAISGKLRVGGSWNLLNGGPLRKLTGNFHDTLIAGPGVPTVRTDITLEEKRKEETSGNYGRLGVLFFPAPGFSIGAALRLPYTRSSDITLARTGTFTVEGQPSTNFEEGATAKSETEFPAEWSVGASIWIRKTARAAGSVTYADWKDAVQIIRNSSDAILLPETTFPYPTLRTTDALQDTLLQWRGGLEYYLGQAGNGFVLRSGIFRDRQPFADATGEHPNFKGYSFGAGYLSRSFRVDVAYVQEKGDVTFSSASRGASHYTNRRWVFGFGFGSP